MSRREEEFLSSPLIVAEQKHCKDEEGEICESLNKNSSTSALSKTCFHGINALSGVGILSVPYALASGGWLSLILLFLMAAVTFYCSILIQRCMDMDPLLASYPDIGHKAFGKTGRLIVSIFVNLELYLVGTSFLILEGDNLDKLFPSVGFHLFGLHLGGRQMFVLLAALFVLPSVWLDDLRILSYVSASGVFASVVILASVFWVGAFDGIGFKNSGSKMFDLRGITTSLSLYAFCYCAHPVFPTLYTSMKNKRQFPLVMIVCFTLCTFTYASMAILGYLMFGSEVKSQITLNLPTQKLSSRVAIYTTLVNPIAKYALMVTPIIDAARNRLPGSWPNKRTAGLFLGTALVISNVIVALLLPFFGELMNLVGAFLSTTASVVLPCLCYLKISGRYRRFGIETMVLIGIILMGIVVVITGTYQSVKDILGRL
ncbi:PREDICTED: vacuolar amino acid transporter 1 isoform X2 [Tarenaya hassleriana]|uniref:vacuolar amino acid transporter 1 isoform X1 n=1 Tax=Tarenaya hassleriana TaxID=28532 RepID=UPI00053C40EE|nr:PREDICTED: vacuolar amino acid transporter 1 isoform X1 [Tarenaya hassleriana]XP_010551854.1 PREDICTED: vacuolar amino acid transporter 1 isoform X2 [Tarenaya hassleriana]